MHVHINTSPDIFDLRSNITKKFLSLFFTDICLDHSGASTSTTFSKSFIKTFILRTGENILDHSVQCISFASIGENVGGIYLIYTMNLINFVFIFIPFQSIHLCLSSISVHSSLFIFHFSPFIFVYLPFYSIHLWLSFIPFCSSLVIFHSIPFNFVYLPFYSVHLCLSSILFRSSLFIYVI